MKRVAREGEKEKGKHSVRHNLSKNPQGWGPGDEGSGRK